MKSKWEVLVKFDDDTEEGISKKLTYMLQSENEEYDSDFTDYEISIIRKNNKIGHESWGRSSDDKIIIFEGLRFTKQEMKWAVKVAKTIAYTLNKNNL